MMLYWRFKRNAPGPWMLGYRTYIDGSSGLVRMGLWHGDTIRGPIVDPSGIETREYR